MLSVSTLFKEEHGVCANALGGKTELTGAWNDHASSRIAAGSKSLLAFTVMNPRIPTSRM